MDGFRRLGVVVIAALALLPASSYAVSSGESSADRAVLVEFYEATGGANWAVNTNWNTDAPLEQWHGVSTDASGRVTWLALDGNQLSGTIPSSLGGLTNLEELDLGGNQLSGPIPSSLGGLTNLELLDLDGNQLSGPIPSSLGGLTNLRRVRLNSLVGRPGLVESLHLGGNQLSGSIPAALCSFADDINPQQGGVILPCAVSSGESSADRAVLVEFYETTGYASWAVSTNWNTDAPLNQWYGVDTDTSGRVTWLDLGDNQLSGTIPASLGSLTNLEVLDLSVNQLSGPIPSSLGGLTNLEWLDLGGNQLSGPIPSSLGGLTNLEWLDLGGNQLSGPIPSSLGGLTNLRRLRLDNNQLSGPIPSSLGGLTNLEFDNFASAALGVVELLHLGGNQLSGTIPAALCRFAGFISRMQQGGVILPCAVSSGESGDDRAVLVEFYESGDDRAVLVEFYETTGGANWAVNTNWNTDAPLDQWYGVSTDTSGRVTRLDLFGNQLSGPIPPSLGGLPNLRVLFLNGNQLSGPIPPSLGGLPNLRMLLLNGNQLSGPIPSSLGGLTNLVWLHLSGNQLSGTIPAALCRFAGFISRQQGGVILPCAVSSGESGDDRAVLVEFYETTGGANWAVNTNWNTDAPLDQWYGVSTDASGRVTGLALNGNQLSGTIPSSLGGLTNLRVLLLNGNQLSGPIPPSLGGLPNLRMLFLFGNQLSGTIPAALCRFAGFISRQQGGVILPCAVSSGESGDDRAVLVDQ